MQELASRKVRQILAGLVSIVCRDRQAGVLCGPNMNLSQIKGIKA